MNNTTIHQFHIPVMGLGFTIDTPIKVARFGISSVISIIEDELIEKMRKHYAAQWNTLYAPIPVTEADHHAKRITAYLDLVDTIVQKQMEQLKALPFEKGNEIVKYFEMLPENSRLKQLYHDMNATADAESKRNKQDQLRQYIIPGKIDVNIMSKVDKMNYNADGTEMPPEFSDALSSLRGFANSTLRSSVVFSAGYNPRLYAYAEQFADFFPNEKGETKKHIILKVSDFRSALVQGKLMAKKGLWISEFRIESGLNCGGHAFATEGLLMGPIMEEFKNKRDTLQEELLQLCNAALAAKGSPVYTSAPEIKITAQGGIGTFNENHFLLEYYGLNATGWGSPFLLVPEATSVDDETLHALSTASKEDFYLSNASPLGVPFNNFRKSSSEKQRKMRIEKGRPGSPCYKKFLSFNTEYTDQPICTASREYQHHKLKELETQQLSAEELAAATSLIIEKDCLCEGLGASALIHSGIEPSHNLTAVTICPGPNLSYFSLSKIFSLQQMVDHIYGRINLLELSKRPNLFVNELNLYVDYLQKEIKKNIQEISAKQNKFFTSFKENLLSGVEYYHALLPKMKAETEEYIREMKAELNHIETTIKKMIIPDPTVAV